MPQLQLMPPWAHSDWAGEERGGEDEMNPALKEGRKGSYCFRLRGFKDSCRRCSLAFQRGEGGKVAIEAGFLKG